MSSTSTSNRRPSRTPPPRRPAPAPRRRPGLVWTAVVVVLVLAIGGLYWVFSANSAATKNESSDPSKITYEVDNPGPGEAAPAFSLPGTNGKKISLSDYRGKTVLLYFQVGLMCQACWDQLTDFQKAPAAKKLKDAGIDDVLTITTDPTDLLARKLKDMNIKWPAAGDPDKAVSKQYHTLGHGMMGNTMNGHSFLLVGPTGNILFRGDYGGPPKYTMYVPIDKLLSDIRSVRPQ